VRILLLLCLALALPGHTSPSQTLPVPRFVSLRAKAVNLHVGPGTNYPVSWKYVKSGLPVEIVAEFDTWREVRDWEGTQGWVHKSLLSSKRMAIVPEDPHPLHKTPDSSSPVVAKLESGVIGNMIECQKNWCLINIEGYKGWIPREKLWGIYPQEDKFK
jgi:SH3-like domain-containing protein